MANLIVSIEGETAVDAVDALNRIEGIHATYDLAVGRVERSAEILAAIVAIIEVISHGEELAVLIVEWFQRRRKAEPGFKAVIEAPNGTRISLEGADAGDVARILRSLPR
jgi:2-keto-3-deoxy-L-rhamnonate aldolase RhmA